MASRTLDDILQEARGLYHEIELALACNDFGAIVPRWEHLQKLYPEAAALYSEDITLVADLRVQAQALTARLLAQSAQVDRDEEITNELQRLAQHYSTLAQKYMADRQLQPEKGDYQWPTA